LIIEAIAEQRNAKMKITDTDIVAVQHKAASDMQAFAARNDGLEPS
jgi:hypothetical protein